MRDAQLFSLILVGFLSSVTVSAMDDRIDLSQGVVFPSNNDALTLNPSAMSKLKGKTIDLGVLLQPEFDSVRVSFTNTDRLGYGFSVQKPRDTAALLGAGVSYGIFSKFSLGVSARLDMLSFQPDWFYGFHWEIDKNFYFAGAGDDAQNFSLGFAGQLSNIFRLEVDLDFQIDSAIQSIGTLITSLGLRAQLSKQFSMLAGYQLQFIPTLSGNVRGLELGLAFWTSKSFGLYGVYNHRDAQYLLGVKIEP